MIRVYKRTWLGQKLIGWVDGHGDTYKNDWNPVGRLILWTMDDSHRVYLVNSEMRNLIGWTDADGNVYDQYGVAYSKRISLWGYNPQVRFDQGIVLRVTPDGRIFKRGLFGHTKLASKVEGTSDVRYIGALALVLLLN